MVVVCSRYRGEKRFIQGFGGKREGKKTFGRPRRRWEHNIKIDLHEVGQGYGLN
jgi:hypothetical protein